MTFESKNGEVEPINLAHLDAVERIARASQESIRPNTRMIYFLGCTIFQPYSLVVKRAEEVIGFMLNFSGKEGTLWWIHQIAIDPNYRAQGYGGKLMTALFELATQQGVTALRLAVTPHNPALAWYRNLGFQELERSPEIDMFIMEKILS